MTKKMAEILFFSLVLFIIALIYWWGNNKPEQLLPQGVVLWKGLYKQNFENSLFRPCDGDVWSSSEPWWWAEGNLKKIDDVALKLNDFTPVYVEFMGQISSTDRNEIPWRISTMISVDNVLEAQEEIPKECR